MEALGLGERGLADSSEIARKGIDEPWHGLFTSALQALLLWYFWACSVSTVSGSFIQQPWLTAPLATCPDTSTGKSEASVGCRTSLSPLVSSLVRTAPFLAGQDRTLEHIMEPACSSQIHQFTAVLTHRPLSTGCQGAFFFNWSIVDLQCYISSRWTAKWFHYFYNHRLFHYKLL